ncbi:MAG: flagellar biosynthesis anti-sigma factor FlgM [Treponemataceae bacterium]|nr:MAG: flagellar biosynthesis anti-sigma factor FlgM [Treponemataceae bacterium]
MMIDKLGGIEPIQVPKTSKTPKNSASTDARDSIDVSNEAVKKAEEYFLNEVAKETPDVRADRIAEVKEKIKDPSYINAKILDSVADKVLDSFGL